MNKPVQSPLSAPTEKTFLQKHWQKFIALGFWLLLVILFFWYKSANNLSNQEIINQIIGLMQGPAGPLIYILAYTLRVFFLFSAAVLTVSAGAIFGSGSFGDLVIAIIYTVIASNISSMVAFFIGQYFGKGLLDSSGEEGGWIQRYIDRLRDNTFEAVLVMRLIYLPYDPVTYLCGFLRVNWKPFLFATILGSIPGTIAFVSFGASLDISQVVNGELPSFDWRVFAFGLVMLFISIAISRYLKKREADSDSQ